jgi:hypothetical protein
MKKDTSFYFSLLIIICITLILSGCKKSNTPDWRDFLGSWISSDLTDTLEFTSDRGFSKMFSGVKDHFDYSLSEDDSIIIKYNGMLFVHAKPSTHGYHFNGDNITIDFRPQCYGFRSQEINFIRKR